MTKTRNLWLSIGFVAVLVLASIAGFATGYLKPVLGLDLEGGVSITLSAPEGTSQQVMNRTLESIRNRVDAFGVGEPDIFVTGTNIEVQIPGLANGTIQRRVVDSTCLIGKDDRNFGCAASPAEADAALKAIEVQPESKQYCIMDASGVQLQCLDTQKAADAALKAASVQKQADQFCLIGQTGQSFGCFADQAAADQAKADLTVATQRNFCLIGEGNTSFGCFGSEEAAEAELAAVEPKPVAAKYCVISSAGQNLGCFLTRDKAETRLQETGQDRLIKLIGTTARLEERQVTGTIAPGDPQYESTPVTCATVAEQSQPKCGFEALQDQPVTYLGEGNVKYQLGPVEITGDAIRKATPIFQSATQDDPNATPGWQVQFELTGDGAQEFGDVTTRLVGQQLAIILDQRVISAPTIQSAITNGSGVITGDFTEQEVKDLATTLNAGALPVALTQQQLVTVSPTLGEESLHQGLVAGIVGLVALALVSPPLLPAARDRRDGRDVHLGHPRDRAHLPGGSRVRLRADARGHRRARDLARRDGRLLHRVLRAAEGRGPERQDAPLRGRAGVQARVQDDRRRGHRDHPRRRGAVPDGRELRPGIRAHAGRRDPARPVRRVLLQAADRVPDRAEPQARLAQGIRASQRRRRRPRSRGARAGGGRIRMTFREFGSVFRGHRVPHFRIIEHSRWWFLLSGTLIALSIVGLFTPGLTLSIDFRGGALITYKDTTGLTAADVQQTMAAFGRPDAEVQTVGGDTVSIRTESFTGDQEGVGALADALAEQAGIAPQEVTVEDVGPTWGSEISRKALTGLVVVLIAILIYIWLRFEAKMAIGAMIAMFHDVIITAGVYVLVGREVTPETVIAILTILGFSLYDTVVIYDKVKENTESLAAVAREGYAGVVNASLNQVLMRSVNTSIVVLFPILSLLLFGGDTLKDFAFAMFVGVVTGAYSSIFVAAPILVVLKEREPRYQQLRSRVAQRSAVRPAAAGAAEPAGTSSETAAVGSAAAAGSQAKSAPATRPRPKSKRKPPAKRRRR